jgi:hypothetical protein
MAKWQADVGLEKVDCFTLFLIILIKKQKVQVFSKKLQARLAWMVYQKIS